MSMTPFEVPLSAVPQTFQIAIAAVVYQVTVRWNSQNQTWVLDLADQGNNPLVLGIPLVTGVDLLEQYGYLGLGFQLVAQTDHDLLAPPTYLNLGATGHLYALVPS